MTATESFQDWRARTERPPEAKELAWTALWPVAVVSAVIIALGGTGYGQAVAMVGFPLLMALILLRRRRLLIGGAKVDDARLVRLRWAQRALCAGFVVGTLLVQLV